MVVDVPPPVLDVADARADEGDVLAFVVTLDAAAGHAVTVDYAPADGTAKAGEDYRAVSGTLTFPPGRTARTVEVEALTDFETEDDETFTLTLSNTSGAKIGDGEARGVVVDVPPPVLDVADARADEGETLAFVVTLDAAADHAVTVDYATADGTATAGDDYTAVSGTLTFPPGRIERTVEVEALADFEAEDDETFTLTLSNASGAEIGDGEARGVVVEVPVPPLTAEFRGVPGEHDGRTAFNFDLVFSENFPGRFPYQKLKDEALKVTNGRAIGVKRASPGQNRNWLITVRPWSADDVTVALPAGSVSTEAGRPLANTVSARVRGPPVPTVMDVAVTSNAGTDSIYGRGDTIRVGVTFSEAVEVEGAPRLRIDMDPVGGGETWAPYERGSGTATLTFAHEVVQPDLSTQGIAVLANTLEPNGGAIRSVATWIDADLAHAGLAHDPKHKVDWQRAAGHAAAASALKDLTPEQAAAALSGEHRLKEAQMKALDELGNRNGRYDLGDMLAWLAARRDGRSSHRRRGPPGGRARRRRAAGPASRGPRRSRLAGAALVAGALASACDQPGLVDPPVGELRSTADLTTTVPDGGLGAGLVQVALSVPHGARDIGAWLTVEGPAIGAIEAPGFEVVEWDGAVGREVILAGPLSEGVLLEFEVPDRGRLAEYRVRVVEVTGEDYGPRDVSAYAVSIAR